MKRHLLASTDITFSALTLGTVKFGRNQSVKYPTAFELPSNQDLSNLLALAKTEGITSLDTAPAYGIAEERIGQLLKNQRHDWQIITKAGEFFDTKNNDSRYDFTPKGLRNSLEHSLRNLKTDYVDCWMLHSDGNDVAHLSDDVLDVFIRAKEQGLTRSIGMSTKTVEGGKNALLHLDCIMMAASLDNTKENELFEIAQQSGKSIFLKKIYDSGWALTNETFNNETLNNKQQNNEDMYPQKKLSIMGKTLHQLFQHPAVCSAIIGTINPEHLLENITALNSCYNNEFSTI